MNNNKANINVRIDAETKELAAGLLNRMGLDQTTAIEMFYRQIIAERRLPFQPIIKPTLDEQILNAIGKTDIPVISLEADAEGKIIIDKDKHPDLFDWAVNG